MLMLGFLSIMRACFDAVIVKDVWPGACGKGDNLKLSAIEILDLDFYLLIPVPVRLLYKEKD